MKNEVWKLIPGCTHYQASNLGRIRSLPSRTSAGKILKLSVDYKGYHRVALRYTNKKQTKLVHRLVAFAFLGKSEMQINHKNGVKTDNRIENLEYVTQTANQLHRIHVLNQSNKRKYSQEQYDEVRKLRAEGLLIKEIVAKTGIPKSSVDSILYIRPKVAERQKAAYRAFRGGEK